MAKQETAVLNTIMLRCSRGLDRIFRNNQGVAWQGDGKPKRVGKSDILITNARAVAYGVGGDGGSDLLGWSSIIITPEMVGQRIAVFTAIEVKRPGGTPTDEQLNFVQRVREAGGRAAVAEAIEQIEWLENKNWDIV